MRPLHKYIGNPILNMTFNIFFGTNFTDTHCGYRAFTKNALNKLNLTKPGMEFALEMIIGATKNKLKIKEIPVNYYRRKGVSKLNSFRDGFRHLFYMLYEWLE